jgi:hypothetical protein
MFDESRPSFRTEWTIAAILAVMIIFYANWASSPGDRAFCALLVRGLDRVLPVLAPLGAALAVSAFASWQCPSHLANIFARAVVPPVVCLIVVFIAVGVGWVFLEELTADLMREVSLPRIR